MDAEAEAERLAVRGGDRMGRKREKIVGAKGPTKKARRTEARTHFRITHAHAHTHTHTHIRAERGSFKLAATANKREIETHHHHHHHHKIPLVC